jgi:two-component system nitrate/nitrite response regulator NarL
MSARVLVVDDHPLTPRGAVRAAAVPRLRARRLAADGEEGCAARPGTPTWRAPRSTGPTLTALPRLREVAPGCEVVVLTASGTEENLLAAIRGGAAGYLLKTESPERIAEFLTGVVHGEAALSGPIARRLLDQVRAGGRGSGVPDRIAAVLSAREVEVLLLLDEHHGTDEIAQRLFISEHTVRSREEPPPQARRVLAPRGLEQLALARS